MKKYATTNPWFFVTALAFVSAARGAYAQTDQGTAVIDRVIKELPSAFARLEAAYSQVRISGTLTEEKRLMSPSAGSGARGDDSERRLSEQPPTEFESTWSHEVVLQASDAFVKSYQNTKYDKYYDKESHSLRDSPIAPLKPARSVACVGRDYSFRLKWEKDTPVLTSLGTTKDEDAKNIARQINAILRAPCGTSAGPSMFQKISFPSFAVRNVTRTSGQNGDRLLIDYECDLADDKNRTLPEPRKKALTEKRKEPIASRRKWKGWIEVSPAEGWAVQAFGAGEWAGRAKYNRQEIVYGAFRDGLPLPRRITWFEPTRAMTRTLEIDSVEFSRRPDSEFTLSYYGIPELDVSSRAKRDNRLALVLLLGSLVALAIAFVLRYYTGRLRTR